MERQIERVKRKLWSFGYSVKDVTGVPGVNYQLLVAGKYPVRVVLKGEPMASGNTVTAVCDADSITYYVCKRGTCHEETSPLKAFPVKS